MKMPAGGKNLRANKGRFEGKSNQGTKLTETINPDGEYSMTQAMYDVKQFLGGKHEVV